MGSENIDVFFTYCICVLVVLLSSRRRVDLQPHFQEPCSLLSLFPASQQYTSSTLSEHCRLLITTTTHAQLLSVLSPVSVFPEVRRLVLPVDLAQCPLGLCVALPRLPHDCKHGGAELRRPNQHFPTVSHWTVWLIILTT
jgi:hypothetical protein